MYKEYVKSNVNDPQQAYKIYLDSMAVSLDIVTQSNFRIED